LEPLYEQGLSWSESICKLRTHDDPRAFWMFLFNLSKVFEFGDTVLVVLRKKKLIMLQVMVVYELFIVIEEEAKEEQEEKEHEEEEILSS